MLLVSCSEFLLSWCLSLSLGGSDSWLDASLNNYSEIKSCLTPGKLQSPKKMVSSQWPSTIGGREAWPPCLQVHILRGVSGLQSCLWHQAETSLQLNPLLLLCVALLIPLQFLFESASLRTHLLILYLRTASGGSKLKHIQFS